MQDATKLQRFFQSKKSMLLLLGKRGDVREQWLEKISALATTDQMVLRTKGRTTFNSTTLTGLFKKHWAVSIVETEHRVNEQLNQILNCLSERKQTCLLLIDNAHLLPISMLAALCYLSYQQEHQPISIRIILAGYPELASKIHAVSLKQYPPPASIKLPCFSENKAVINKSVKTYHVARSSYFVGLLAIFGLFFGGFWEYSEYHSATIHLVQSLEKQITHHV